MRPHDLNEYVGLPFRLGGRTRDGIDCYGLLRLVYSEQLGIELPAYAGEYVDGTERTELAAIVSGGLESDWEPVERPFTGDAVVTRVIGQPTHVGVYIEPDRMLHIRREAGSCIERLGSSAWSRRVEGFFRCRRSA